MGFTTRPASSPNRRARRALKSLLYYLGARRIALLTHSLVEMLGEAAKRLPELAQLLAEARELDLHYIPSRYPNGLPSGYPHAFYGREMAEGAVAAADRILGAVTRHYRDAGDQDLLTGSDS